MLEEKRLSGTEFGEGLTVVHGKVMQLLWKTNDVVVWGRNTWEREEGVVSPMADGWGLAYR